MKKHGFGALCLLLCALTLAFVSLSACGNHEPGNENDLPVLKIGSDDYPPYFYIDESGNFSGVDVVLATEACRRLGYRAEFIKIEWVRKDEYLEEGAVDCLWGSFTMTGREDEYLWAGPYMKSRQVVVVKEDSAIYSLSDLAGKRVGVQMTTKPDEIFSAGNFHLKDLYCLPKTEDIFAALRKGYVDAVAGHEIAMNEYLRETSDANKYRILSETLMEGELGVALYKNGDVELRQKITEALSEMQKDGFIAAVVQSFGLAPAMTEVNGNVA